MTGGSWGWWLAQVCARLLADYAMLRRRESCAGFAFMRCTTLSMALIVVLGCSGHSNETSNGATTDASGMTDVGTPTSGEAGPTSGEAGPTSGEAGPMSGDASASSSSDAIAPVPCDPGLVDAGAVSTGDAEVPLNHRPTAACCPAQRGPGPSGQPYPTCTYEAGSVCPADHATTCSSDSECTAGVNGRCFPFEGLVGPGGCSYDECFTDSNCGPKTPCSCRSSSTDNSANVCDVGGNCAVDSDCGPGGYCSFSDPILNNGAANVCYGPYLYYCHTASDTCINDSDCGPLDSGTPPESPANVCAYNTQDNRWECTKTGCAAP
jgi:hypothetical protein